jgi:hypothetical protein
MRLNLCGSLSQTLERQQSNKMTTQRSRYRGVTPFGEKDSHLFYGRSRDVNALLDCIRGRSLSIVYGPPGSGKTSLLRAGLADRLKEFTPSDGEGASWDIISPNVDDLLPRLNSIRKSKEEQTKSFLDQNENTPLNEESGSHLKEPNRHAQSIGQRWLLRAITNDQSVDEREDESTLNETASHGEEFFTDRVWKAIENRYSSENQKAVLIVFDQFERILNNKALSPFVSDLSSTLKYIISGRGRLRGECLSVTSVKVVICLRHDSLYLLDVLNPKFEAQSSFKFCVGQLSHQSAVDAICKPGELESPEFRSPTFRFEPNAIKKILRGVQIEDTSVDQVGRYDPLLLQIACLKVEQEVIAHSERHNFSAEINRKYDDVECKNENRDSNKIDDAAQVVTVTEAFVSTVNDAIRTHILEVISKARSPYLCNRVALFSSFLETDRAEVYRSQQDIKIPLTPLWFWRGGVAAAVRHLVEHRILEESGSQYRLAHDRLIPTLRSIRGERDKESNRRKLSLLALSLIGVTLWVAVNTFVLQPLKKEDLRNKEENLRNNQRSVIESISKANLGDTAALISEVESGKVLDHASEVSWNAIREASAALSDQETWDEIVSTLSKAIRPCTTVSEEAGSNQSNGGDQMSKEAKAYERFLSQYRLLNSWKSIKGSSSAQESFWVNQYSSVSPLSGDASESTYISSLRKYYRSQFDALMPKENKSTLLFKSYSKSERIQSTVGADESVWMSLYFRWLLDKIEVLDNSGSTVSFADASEDVRNQIILDLIELKRAAWAEHKNGGPLCAELRRRRESDGLDPGILLANLNELLNRIESSLKGNVSGDLAAFAKLFDRLREFSDPENLNKADMLFTLDDKDEEKLVTDDHVRLQWEYAKFLVDLDSSKIKEVFKTNRDHFPIASFLLRRSGSWDESETFTLPESRTITEGFGKSQLKSKGSVPFEVHSDFPMLFLEKRLEEIDRSDDVEIKMESPKYKGKFAEYVNYTMLENVLDGIRLLEECNRAISPLYDEEGNSSTDYNTLSKVRSLLSGLANETMPEVAKKMKNDALGLHQYFKFCLDLESGLPGKLTDESSGVTEKQKPESITLVLGSWRDVVGSFYHVSDKSSSIASSIDSTSWPDESKRPALLKMLDEHLKVANEFSSWLEKGPGADLPDEVSVRNPFAQADIAWLLQLSKSLSVNVYPDLKACSVGKQTDAVKNGSVENGGRVPSPLGSRLGSLLAKEKWGSENFNWVSNSWVDVVSRKVWESNSLISKYLQGDRKLNGLATIAKEIFEFKAANQMAAWPVCSTYHVLRVCTALENGDFDKVPDYLRELKGYINGLWKAAPKDGDASHAEYCVRLLDLFAQAIEHDGRDFFRIQLDSNQEKISSAREVVAQGIAEILYPFQGESRASEAFEIVSVELLIRQFLELWLLGETGFWKQSGSTSQAVRENQSYKLRTYRERWERLDELGFYSGADKVGKDEEVMAPLLRWKKQFSKQRVLLAESLPLDPDSKKWYLSEINAFYQEKHDNMPNFFKVLLDIHLRFEVAKMIYSNSIAIKDHFDVLEKDTKWLVDNGGIYRATYLAIYNYYSSLVSMRQFRSLLKVEDEGKDAESVHLWDCLYSGQVSNRPSIDKVTQDMMSFIKEPLRGSVSKNPDKAVEIGQLESFEKVLNFIKNSYISSSPDTRNARGWLGVSEFKIQDESR